MHCHLIFQIDADSPSDVEDKLAWLPPCISVRCTIWITQQLKERAYILSPSVDGIMKHHTIKINNVIFRLFQSQLLLQIIGYSFLAETSFEIYVLISKYSSRSLITVLSNDDRLAIMCYSWLMLLNVKCVGKLKTNRSKTKKKPTQSNAMSDKDLVFFLVWTEKFNIQKNQI